MIPAVGATIVCVFQLVVFPPVHGMCRAYGAAKQVLYDPVLNLMSRRCFASNNCCSESRVRVPG